MVRNKEYYEKAIKLRREGLSYNEILRQVPVAKSTIALWLHSVGLSKRVKHILTEKKRLAALSGAKARHDERIRSTRQIFKKCKEELGPLSKRDIFILGIALYWAEGSKEKEEKPGSSVRFTNSDARMVKLFLVWLLDIAKVTKEKIHFSIYIHANQADYIDRQRIYWSEQTGFDLSCFNRVYYKVHRLKTNRINIGDSYHGVLNVNVRSSSVLLRKIAGWVQAMS